MRRVVITALHSFISKNILNAGVLPRLLEDSSVEIILLVPSGKATFFRRHFALERVKVEEVDTAVVSNKPLERFFKGFARLLIDSHYHWYKRAEKRDLTGGIKAWAEYWVSNLFVKVLSRLALMRWLFRACESALLHHRTLEALIVRLKPAVMFVTDVFDPTDAAILRETKRLKIPTVGMVRSWDNCYSKGLLRVIPDHLLVNSAHLRLEAHRYHDVPLGRLEVVGLPQFDRFLNEARLSKQDFFASIGADPSKELVLFAPGGSILSDTDWQIYEQLVKARDDGKFVKPVLFYVRNHPHHPADFTRTRIRPGDIIENPGEILNPENPKETELAPRDNAFLADLLANASILLWVATTLGLDAAVFNRPQVAINFDGDEQKQYTKSVKRYHDEDHMKKLLVTGGVRVVNSASEMVTAVNAYLTDSTLDQEGRTRIIAEQLYRLDGKAAERVANAVRAQLY